jgi:hypothetical protein
MTTREGRDRFPELHHGARRKDNLSQIVRIAPPGA